MHAADLNYGNDILKATTINSASSFKQVAIASFKLSGPIFNTYRTGTYAYVVEFK